MSDGIVLNGVVGDGIVLNALPTAGIHHCGYSPFGDGIVLNGVGLYRVGLCVKDYTEWGALALWPDRWVGDGIVLNGLVGEGVGLRRASASDSGVSR